MNTRKIVYEQGFYRKLNNGKLTMLKTRNKSIIKRVNLNPAFKKVLNDDIVKSLNFKKRERLVIERKIEISHKLYNELKQQYDLKFKCVQCQNLLTENNILYRRFFPDKSCIQIILDSFKVKIMRKKEQVYYTCFNGRLEENLTNKVFYFQMKFFKEEKTAHHTRNEFN